MPKVYKANRLGTYSNVPDIAKFNKDKETDLVKMAEYVSRIYPHYDFCMEVYNSKSVHKMPDTIGMNIFYPSANDTTHLISKEFPIGITEKQVKDFLIEMCEELNKKIPKRK